MWEVDQQRKLKHGSRAGNGSGDFGCVGNVHVIVGYSVQSLNRSHGSPR